MSARNRCAAAASVLVAVAIAAPSAAAAADTTPPSAPTEAEGYVDFQCTGRTFVGWAHSTDNVDSLTDLRYRFYDAQGNRMQATGFAGTFETGVPSDPTGAYSWASVERIPATVRAVDRAGNLSAPAPVKAVGHPSH